MIYYLHEAVAVARQIQPITYVCGWHTTVGGGVLIRGFSTKDIDIFLYAHTRFDGTQTVVLPPPEVVQRLKGVGIIPRHKLFAPSATGGKYKKLYQVTHHDTPVDLIFLDDLSVSSNHDG